MLFTGSESGSVRGGVFGFEAVETPDECQAKVAGHVTHFHTVVLALGVDVQCRRPFVENVVGFKVKFAATLFAELRLIITIFVRL